MLTCARSQIRVAPLPLTTPVNYTACRYVDFLLKQILSTKMTYLRFSMT